jgi:hypothetical protein
MTLVVVDVSDYASSKIRFCKKDGQVYEILSSLGLGFQRIIDQ